MESIYLQLKKEIEYALNSKSLTLAYQAYGAVKMAYHLKAIGKEQFFILNDMVITNGINKPSALLGEKAEIEQAIKNFSKTIVDYTGNGLISHTCDIVDFTADYLNKLTEV